MIRVGVVGLGLIGAQRAEAVQTLARTGESIELVGAFDPRPDARDLAPGTRITPSVRALVALRPDWVIVATPHDVAVAVVTEVLGEDIRVLVEKPLGRSGEEARLLSEMQRQPDQLWVGFTYRFFDGIAALVDDARSGRFGDLVSVTMALGHGGAPGDERSWKLDPTRAGGGCLIDPGVHLLDIARLIDGPDVQAVAGTSIHGFWRTGVEEESHVLLRGSSGATINVQVSIVRWRSTFRLEVHGMDGYGIVDGRGRSYGPQVYRRGRRWGWREGSSQAESEEAVCETDGSDMFERELRALMLGQEVGPLGPCSAVDATATMALVDACRRLATAPMPSKGLGHPVEGA